MHANVHICMQGYANARTEGNLCGAGIISDVLFSVCIREFYYFSNHDIFVFILIIMFLIKSPQSGVTLCHCPNEFCFS